MVKALVLYHSQEFGNTHAMAEAVAEGLRALGCEVDLFNTDEGRFDVARFPQYDCAAFGSPDPSAAMWQVG
ncbi:MAG TPA: flavodoxin domain-containing protein [Anaerolineae bacterium]|nr:flavodoxin domain-containing protein [Anaerolineae bacterium]